MIVFTNILIGKQIIEYHWNSLIKTFFNAVMKTFVTNDDIVAIFAPFIIKSIKTYAYFHCQQTITNAYIRTIYIIFNYFLLPKNQIV